MKNRYYGLNDLSLSFFIKENFLKLEPKQHSCKISLNENILDLLSQGKSWLKTEWDYHLFLSDSQRFFKDYSDASIDKTKNKPLLTEIENKIEELKKIECFNDNKSQEKYFNQIVHTFLKNFNYKKATSILDDIFDQEFFEFLNEGLLIAKNKKLFDKFSNQTKDFIKYWFFYQKNYFLIFSKINCFSKKFQNYIVQELILLLDEKMINGIIQDLPSQEVFKWLKLIFEMSPDKTEFVTNKILDFLKADDYYDPYLYFSLLDNLWELFQSTSIRKIINLEQQYHFLKIETSKKINWQKLSNESIEDEIKVAEFEKFILEKFNYAKKYAQDLIFILTGKLPNKEKIINILTSNFKKEQTRYFFQFLEKKIFYDSNLIFKDEVIELTILKINELLFVKNQFNQDYLKSLNIMIDIFIKYFNLENEEKFKINFFMNAIKDKLINKYDTSLITKYNFLFLEISLLETILLILHNWKLKKENKPPIIIADAIKLKREVIAEIDEINQKITFIKNEFISEETLNYIYFNLYAPTSVGGLDIRNKFIHGDTNVLYFCNHYSTKVLIIVLSVWEEIIMNICLKYWSTTQ